MQRGMRQRRRSRRGGAAVEFALVMPAMIALVLGCIDFGRFAYDYLAVTNAARAGTSFAMMNPPTAATMSTWYADVRQAVANEMGPRPGFNANNVVVTRISEAGGLYRDRVNVPYQFKMVFYWKWLGIPSTVNLQSAAEMREVRP